MQPSIAKWCYETQTVSNPALYEPVHVLDPKYDWKPSWPVFGNKGENCRQITRLSHYGLQKFYPSIFQSCFMRRFHFWSRFAHIFPSDGIKNCLRKAKIKTSFWNVSRDCIEIWCFWARIRNLRTKLRLCGSFYDHWWFLWVTRHRILILVEILFLLFANSTTGSGINRPRIRIRRGRKYPQLTGIKVFFLIRCAPLPLHMSRGEVKNVHFLEGCSPS